VVKRIDSYQFARRFRKEYRKLPKDIQEAFEKKLSLLLIDPSQQSLRVKQLQGTKDQWEGSITRNYRFTFELCENEALFRTIGTHDILERQ
jgi:mRNA-degrading endonuclease RelE of RelBE toxin-antitoxin system